MNKALAIAMAALLAAACSAPEKDRWTQPGSGAAPKSADSAACRSEANRRAEREFLLDTQSGGSGGFGQTDIVQNELARRDAKRYRQRIYENCLRGLGYQKAPAGGPRAR